MCAIAATNVTLLDLIQLGKFRDDLYYRLNTVPIHVPPLRDRKEDIYMLFRKFSLDFADKYRSQPVQLDEEAKSILTNYPWPGNVRELKNVAEQISVLSKSKTLNAAEMKSFLPSTINSGLPSLIHRNGSGGSDFSERELMYKVLFDMKNDLNELKKVVSGAMSGNAPVAERPPVYPVNEANGSPIVIDKGATAPIEIEETLSIADKEKELIIKALKKHRNRRKDAASDLGISERTLYRKIKEYNIPEK